MKITCLKSAVALLLIFSTLVVQADTVLITGANRGIGHEFARQFAVKGWHVIATHRRDKAPESLTALQAEYPKVQIETLDVTNTDHLNALVEILEGQPIDILINNAGTMGLYMNAKPGEPNENFGNMDYEGFDTYYHVNVRAPVQISEALYENVKASKMKIIAAVSSRQGSITEALYGGAWVWYSGTKAALNRTMIGLASHVKKDDVKVLVLAPTLTYTERMEFLRKTRGDTGVEVDVAVEGFIETLINADMEDSGKIFHWDGTLGPY